MSTSSRDLALPADARATTALVEHRASFARKYATMRRHSIAFDSRPIQRLALSLDGRALAGAATHTLCVWDTVTRNRTHRFQFDVAIQHVALSGDGRRVLIADASNALILLDRATGSRTQIAAVPQPITAIALDAEGTTCAYATARGPTRILDAMSGQLRLSIETRDIPSRLELDSVRDFLLVVQPGRAAVYRLGSGEQVADYGGEARPEPGLDLPWARIVAVHNRTVRVFDAATGDVVGQSRHLAGALDYTRDGTRVVAAQGNRTMLWDGCSRELLLYLQTYTRIARDVKISADGGHIYTCGYDSTVDVHTSAGQWRASLADAYCSIVGVVSTNSDRQLVVADEQGLVSVYDVEAGSVARFLQHDSCIAKLKACGTYVATSSYDGTAAVLDIESGETIRRVGNAGVAIQGVELDGQELVITGNAIGAVQAYDIGTGALVREFPGNTAAVRSVCVSPCRRYLVTTAENGAVLLFDYATGALIHKLAGFNIVYEACFDGEGEHLFFGDRIGSVKRVRTASGSAVDCWSVLKSEVRSIRYYNDRVCAVGLFDDAVVLDPRTGAVALRVPIDSRLCHRVVMLCAGANRLVVGAQDGRLWFHDATSGELMAELHHMKSGFLWTTGPTDDAAHGEWFWTDRPELMNVYSATNGQETRLSQDDVQRTEYVRAHNSRAATMGRVGLSARAAKRDVAAMALTYRSARIASERQESLEWLGA